MSEAMVAIVTGAVGPLLSHSLGNCDHADNVQNRGIGQAIAQLLASSSTPIIVYAASRKGEDCGIRPARNNKVVYPQLDISSPKSLQSLADQIKQTHGRLDILINNGAVNLDDKYNAENAKTTMDVNYRGTLQSCRTFIPLMPEGGRVVNLSSVGSSLSPYSPAIQERFRNRNMKWDDLEQLARDFEQAAEHKRERDAGFAGPGKSYSVSKACVNGLTAILARENPDLTINCCCPGWVDTDMGGMLGRPPKSAMDGAKIPVRLAVGDLGGVSGRYWANDSISDTGDGHVQTW